VTQVRKSRSDIITYVDMVVEKRVLIPHHHLYGLHEFALNSISFNNLWSLNNISNWP
jgi:hypothetical protein